MPRLLARKTLCAMMIGALAATLGCSRYGLIRDSYPDTFYKIPKRFADDRIEENPRFIIYGDNRPGWRAKEVLLARDTWLTWKQLYLPGIYQLYLVGTGVVGGINYLAWHPDYGDREARLVRDAVYARAKTAGADFIMNTGDIVTDGRRVRDWKRFLEQNAVDVPLVREFPYLAVAGNHDWTNDSTYALPNFADVFSMPLFFVFECPDVDFFLVDSNLLIDQYGQIDDVTQDALFERWFVADNGTGWLETRLAASRKAFKIVVMHHPPVAFAKHYDNWATNANGNDLTQKRQTLLELFAKEAVQIVFSGHQHMYEHNTLTSSDIDNQTIHFVVTGGGGAPLHRSSSEEEIIDITAGYKRLGLDVVCQLQETVYNYCLVDAQPDKITIRAVEVPMSDEKAGRVIEQFVVTKRGWERE